MKALILGLLFVMNVQGTYAQNAVAVNDTSTERELINLSKEKWNWMADKEADTLADLFHEKSMFIHMGGSWGKEQEIKVIRCLYTT